MKKGIILVMALGVFLPLDRAHADKRSYVWTYEYLTVPRGVAELETYYTISTPDAKHSEGKTSAEHQVELEVGMTDRFDFAVYQVFGQPAGEDLAYEGIKLRARYRFGEKGQWFLDPLVYLEYKSNQDFSEEAVEAKLILAKDIGNFNIAVNPVVEFEEEPEEDEWETEWEYAVGMSYGFHELLRLGLEAKGSEEGHYLGPVISHGTEKLWVTLGSAYQIGGVEEGEPALQFRLLLGVGLD